MKPRSLISLLLSLLLALGLTACGGEESQPAPDPQPDPAPASEPVQEAPSLSQLREEAQNAGADAAIAFLGSLSQGEAMSDFLSGSSLVEDYPFLADMDEAHTVRAAGSEVYCLVPVRTDAPLTVQAFVIDESNQYLGEAGETLYESQAGEPVLLVCNISDIMPNLLVTLTGADGRTCSFNPFLSLCSGQVDLPAEPVLYDFSRYDSVGYGETQADFLGTWTSADLPGQLSFAEDGTMTFSSGGETLSGTFYIISDSATGSYRPGDVLFELTGDARSLWGTFAIQREGEAITVTHTAGDPLLPGWENAAVSFTR